MRLGDHRMIQAKLFCNSDKLNYLQDRALDSGMPPAIFNLVGA
jgi:hypothetical protein